MARQVLFQDRLVNKSIIMVISTIVLVGTVALILAINYLNIPTMFYPFLSLSLVVPLVLLALLYRIDIVADDHNITITLGVGLIKSIIPYTAIVSQSIKNTTIEPQSTGLKKQENNILYSMTNVDKATTFSTKSNNHYTIATNKAEELTAILKRMVE